MIPIILIPYLEKTFLLALELSKAFDMVSHEIQLEAIIDSELYSKEEEAMFNLPM